MSVKVPSLTEISEKYNKIIENYESIHANLKNIFDDIKTLEGIHNIYINSIDMSSLNYSIYVDDIKHQINITQNEHDYINNTYLMNIEKLYRDLFKLYNRVTKIILSIFKENKDTIVKIWNSSEKSVSETHDFKKFKKAIRTLSENVRAPMPIINDNKIFEEIKKQYYSEIRIYNELNNYHKYDLNDVIVIFNNLIKRFEELELSKELIKMSINDIKNKTDKGVLGQTFVMDLNGKSDRITVDYNILLKLLESIIGIHTSLSEKYKNMAQTIADQVNYTDDTTELLTESETNKDIKDFYNNDN